jgi:vitamin B12/bleomycin/antimicrobial peptide transport system ATP-binding/permease protein
MKNLLAALKDIGALSFPYFKDKTQNTGVLRALPFNALAVGLLFVILAINVGQVYLHVALNEWSVPFYTALQKKDGVVFWAQMKVFAGLALLFISSAVAELYLTLYLDIKWRAWMTRQFTQKWLTNHAHYKLGFSANTDNPDQRITDDVREFVRMTLDIFVKLFSTVLTLWKFAIILWMLSSNFPLQLFGVEMSAAPGYLFWVALAYSAFGTIVTHYIGRSLVRINFLRQKTEANFRFSLARIREYGEPIGLLKGEAQEKATLFNRFSAYVHVYSDYMRVQKNMTFFTAFFGQASVMFPYLLCASAYFAVGGTMEFGALTQVTRAFGTVESSLNVFIKIYGQLAEYRATINRLTSFMQATDQAAVQTGDFTFKSGDMAFKDVKVTLPSGQVMVQAQNLTLEKGKHLLVTGPSGSGKSTLFRALAGLWPYGSGEMTTPSSLMLIPQKPYLPLGTLKEALLYPNLEADISDERLLEVLSLVQLDKYAGSLNEDKPWHLILSGGEQQKLSLARALLQQPEWLFLDEATAAMDETSEGQLYAMLKKALPQTTLVSIGHRSTLVNYHDKRVQLVKTGESFIAQDAPLMMMKTA